MANTRRILVDFDGVLMQKGKRKAVDGALEAMNALRRQGYQVVVFSTRETSGANSRPGFVKEWLEANQIPYDGITGEKLDATYYIDDKAVEFNSWRDTLDKVI
jgi:ribonucleotide monophosphatase NagD (HAD superfamily)